MWYDIFLRKGLIPEPIIRWGIRSKIAGRISADPTPDRRAEYIEDFHRKLSSSPIAINEEDANDQHYEVPSEFFEIVLGPMLKYSSCYYDSKRTSLGEAEVRMLNLTVERARVGGNQTILELGCGWGSLTIHMAQAYPSSRITAVSNSATQKKYIEQRAKQLEIDNIRVITANVTELVLEETFDRVVSVEMFEHMRNYSKLFAKVKSWTNPDGFLFIHIFARHGVPYLFEEADTSSFIARYFFTGGTMPSVNTLPRMAEKFFQEVERWEISGVHYQRTLEDWLTRMKKSKSEVLPILKAAYGSEQRTWWNYWKIFFMGCAELWGYDDGKEWVVMHYLLKPESD